jgi:hypothetical protein
MKYICISVEDAERNNLMLERYYELLLSESNTFLTYSFLHHHLERRYLILKMYNKVLYLWVANTLFKSIK